LGRTESKESTVNSNSARRGTAVRVSAVLCVPLLLAACSSSTSGGDSAQSDAPASAATASSASGSAAASDNGSGNMTAPLPTGGIALADTNWTLSGVNWTTADVAKFKITMEFTADKVGGFAGVNRYNGGYTSATDGTLQFEQMVVTMMAGEPEAMKMESDFLAALGKVTNYSASDQLLDLFAGPDQTMTFKRAN
jgi:heat shock protein HslJ